MKAHTLKWAPTLGIRISMDFQNFKEQLKGSKLIRLKNSLCYWKALRIQMFKMGSHVPFEYLKHKLWLK